MEIEIHEPNARLFSNSGVRVLTFDRPDSAANIFDAATLMELNEKLDGGRARAPTGVVFISAKPAIFIAGADLQAVETLDGDELARVHRTRPDGV